MFLSRKVVYLKPFTYLCTENIRVMKELMTIKEYADWKGVTYEAVRKRVRKGRIPSIIVGSTTLVKLTNQEQNEWNNHQRHSSRAKQ